MSISLLNFESVFEKNNHYKASLINGELEAAKCNGMIRHAFDFFNLINDPCFVLQPSTELKWQLLHASKSSMNQGRILLDPNFGISHLPARDLALLYRILLSYKTENSEGRQSAALVRRHLYLIEEEVINRGKQGVYEVKAFLDALKEQEDAHLYRLINEVDEWIKIIPKLSASEKTNSAINILDENYSSTDNFSYNERELKFYSILRMINAFIPEIFLFNYFFNFCELGEVYNSPDIGAMRTILKYYGEKDKYKNKIDNIEFVELTDLSKRLIDLEAVQFRGDKKFVILLRGLVGGHYSTIFLRKTENDSRILFSDSGGIAAPMHWIDQVKNEVIKADLKNVIMEVFAPTRQSDDTSCSISALRDILESSQIDLFHYIDNLPKDQMKFENGIKIISYYPPSFMKIKQSVTYLNDYEKCTNTNLAIVASKKILLNGQEKIQEKTLRQVVQDHTIIAEGHRINFYLRKKAFKCFIIAIKLLLKEDGSCSI
ncbi:MAG: hypothetical protein KGI80_04295 [Verrucomicrobiota bacterium]|nr:hypothetical protein [Verrucomicrobiota bacterium]